MAWFFILLLVGAALALGIAAMVDSAREKRGGSSSGGSSVWDEVSLNLFSSQAARLHAMAAEFDTSLTGPRQINAAGFRSGNLQRLYDEYDKKVVPKAVERAFGRADEAASNRITEILRSDEIDTASAVDGVYVLCVRAIAGDDRIPPDDKEGKYLTAFETLCRAAPDRTSWLKSDLSALRILEASIQIGRDHGQPQKSRTEPRPSLHDKLNAATDGQKWDWLNDEAKRGVVKLVDSMNVEHGVDLSDSLTLLKEGRISTRSFLWVFNEVAEDHKYLRPAGIDNRFAAREVAVIQQDEYSTAAEKDREIERALARYAKSGEHVPNSGADHDTKRIAQAVSSLAGELKP